MEQMQTFTTRVHVHITHYRKRLCDPDNLNCKACIDAAVDMGLLQDDSAKWIESITHTQIKSADEKTVMKFTEVVPSNTEPVDS